MSQALDNLHSKLIASQQADDDAFGAFDAVLTENAGLVKQIADLTAKLAAGATPVLKSIDTIISYVNTNFSAGDTRAARIRTALTALLADVAGLGQPPIVPPVDPALQPLPQSRDAITAWATSNLSSGDARRVDLLKMLANPATDALSVYSWATSAFNGGDSRLAALLKLLPTTQPTQPAVDPLAVTLAVAMNKPIRRLTPCDLRPILSSITAPVLLKLAPGAYQASSMLPKGVDLVAEIMPATAFDQPTVTIDGMGGNALSPTGGNLIAGFRFVNCAEAIHAINADDWMVQDCMMDWPTTGKFAWVQNCANWTLRRVFAPNLTGDQNLARVASSGTNPSRNGRFEYCVGLGQHKNPVVRLPGVDGIDFLGCLFFNEGDDVITVQDGDTYLQGYRSKNVRINASTFRGDVQANPGCQNVTGADVKFLSGGAVVGNETFFQQRPQIPQPENFVIALGAGAVATEAALKAKGIL